MVRCGSCRLFAFLLFLVALGLPSAFAQTELIVRFEDGAAPEPLRALQQGRIPAGDPLFRDARSARPLLAEGAAPQAAWTRRVYVIRFEDEAARRAATDRWRGAPGVRYVQPNGRYQLDLADAGFADLDDETYADSLTHLRVIRADEAWEQTSGAASVKIALIDTGLYFEHPDFQGQVWTNPGEIPDNGLDDDGNGFIDDVRGYDFVDRAVGVEEGDFFVRDNDPSEDGTQDHGTLVAGVLSAAMDGSGVVGVAPGATLVPIRAFGRDGVAEDDDLAAALVYAATLGVDVVNLSFGREQDSPLLHEAIRYVYARGTVVVASGGNAGGDDPHYPSDYAEVIGVAWFTADGQSIESEGQHGPGIALGAPGTQVFTTLKPREGDPRPLEEKRYGRRNGSSLSAPQVSATAALLRSLDPTLTPESIRGILTSTARDVGDPGWDHETGAGLLDVANALGLPYPTNVSLISPEQDGGTAEDAVVVAGSAIAPLFASWRVEYAPYDDAERAPIGAWQPIAGPVEVQVREDTLGTWATAALAEGTYLLRLVVELRNGQTLEDRRRVTVDRTAPSLDVKYAGPAYFDGRQGVLVEVETDDVTHGRLTIDGGPSVEGNEWERRYGLFWPNPSAQVGPVSVQVTATNRAGLTATTEAPVSLDVLPLNTSLFSETVLDAPSGYLLEKATDFDGDGLLEIVFNAFVEGEPSDSVLVYEWSGEPDFFVRQAALPAQLIPRDEGDTDGDGRRELLFQFGPNTMLVEAPVTPQECLEDPDPEPEPDRCYPTAVIFSDLTPTNSTRRPLWGARLGDLDEDGLGEIWGHDLRLRNPAGESPETKWRVMEQRAGSYDQVAELENPTANSDPEEPVNTFNEPRGLIGQFDTDLRFDWVTGDNDGDFIVYESVGNDAYAPIWTHETGRYGAGSRFAQGDFDGDGIEEFWGFTTPKTAGGADDALFGLALLFDGTADDAFELRETLAFQGLATRFGAMGAADFDGDGTDELIVVHPPDLWVFSAAADWQPIFHAGAVPGADGPTGLRSYTTTVADFDADGVAEVVVAGADGRMRLFDYNFGQAGLAPPVWTEAFARDADAVHLAWSAPGADSVRVFAAPPGGAFSLVATTTEAEVDVPTSDLPAADAHDYTLRAYYGTTPSDLGPVRRVRPHAPAVVEAVSYPAADYVVVAFTEPLDPGVRGSQFVLDGAREAASALLQDGGHAVVLHFPGLAPGPAHLTWTALRDAEGTPVGQQTVDLTVPADALEGTLLLVSWDVLDGGRAVLRFSEPLDPAAARDPSNYRIDPSGTVEAVAFDAEAPEEVVLTIGERALGATGLRTSVVVTAMEAASGATLAPEGSVATLTAFAADLADVYAFPNPYRQAEHGGRVVVAGLPREATVTVYSLAGEVVRRLEEFDGDGGAPWDLTDESGAPVPSGVYLIRVESGDLAPVIEKVAVIR